MKFEAATESFMHLVPGCPWTEAIDALRLTLIDFCERTHAVSYWVDKTSTDITIDVSSTAQVMPVSLFDAYVSGKQVEQLRPSDVAVDGVTYLSFDPELLHASMAVVPAPAAPVPVRLLLSWAPTPWATEFADQLWLRRQEALRAGALARLLSAPGMPYANAGSASIYASTYEAGLASAKTSASVRLASPVRRLRVQPAE